MFSKATYLAVLSTTASANLRMASSVSRSSLKIGVCQVAVGADKAVNIATTKKALETAAEAGANMVVLPECWNSPYSTACFPEYAEMVPNIGEAPNKNASPSYHMVCETAKETGTWVVGGSVPERDDTGKLYNTCLVVNPSGDVVGRHRKIHLFDIDIPGKIKFKESDSLTGGDTLTVVDTPWGGLGVGICYDMRFPELALLMRQEAKKSCNILVYPGAFNMVTGAAHWELLQRARAVDNQVFVVTCSPARDTAPDAVYTAWGHSMIVSPWGEVIQELDAEPGIAYADLDLSEVDTIRTNIPYWNQKRTDLYDANLKNKAKL